MDKEETVKCVVVCVCVCVRARACAVMRVRKCVGSKLAL